MFFIASRSINPESTLPTINLPAKNNLDAFYGCTSLTNISVGTSNPNYSSLNGVLFNKAQAALFCRRVESPFFCFVDENRW